LKRPDPPAIALIEFASIARAIRTGDAMVKRAEVRVQMAEPVSPGKYLILITGGEAEVEESWQEGVEIGAGEVVDSLYLPGVHGDALGAIHGAEQRRWAQDALAVVECASVAGAIVACDAACKEAPVRVLEMRLAKGIGGKGVFTLAGELWDLQASVEAATRAVEERRCLVAVEIVPRPDGRFEGGLS